MQKPKCKIRNFNSKIKNTRYKIFATLLIFNFLFFPFAASAAIGVSPERLEFDRGEKNELTKKIFIENLNNFPIQVRVQASKHPDLVTIQTEQITLPPGTLQDIGITVKSKKNFSDEIEIVSYESTQDQLAIQAGVKIPLTVRNSFQKKILFALFSTGIITSAIFFITSRKKNISYPPD